VDGLWATKNEDVGLIFRALSFQDFQPKTQVILIHQRYRQRDGRTDDMQSRCTIVHRAVKTG